MDARKQSNSQTLVKIDKLTKRIEEAWLDKSDDFCLRGYAYLELALHADDEEQKKCWLQNALNDADSAVSSAFFEEKVIRAFLLRGTVDINLRNFKNAIYSLKVTLGLSSNEKKIYANERAQAYDGMAHAYYHHGEKDKAIKCYYSLLRDYPKLKNTDQNRDKMRDILLELDSNELSMLSKKDIFIVIKKVAIKDRLSLLRACLNPETVLGKRMWKPESVMFNVLGVIQHESEIDNAFKCDYGKGMLKAIEDHLVSIDPTHVRHEPVHKSVSVKQPSDLNNDKNERYDSLYSL